MWIFILKQYWRVTVFKETPANTPYSVLASGVAALIYFLIIIWQWALVDVKNQFSADTRMLAAAFLIVSYYLYTALLLYVSRKKNRFLQTVTALIVSHLIILIIGFILMAITPSLVKADMNLTAMKLLLFFYILKMLALAFWQFMVAAHIYQQALESDYYKSVLASFGLLATNILTLTIWR